MSCYFITGTDTDCGKTTAMLALIKQWQAKGDSVIGLKPIAAGINAQGQNTDAVQLQQANSIPLPYSSINPYLFKDPISPHLAAAKEHQNIDLDWLKIWLEKIKPQAQIILVEGAGGWYAPISETKTMADIPMALNIPVIVVVGMKLGCLNHALLTIESIKYQKGVIAGWIANQIDPQMKAFEGNLETLKNRIQAPFLGVIPFQQNSKSREYTTLSIQG